MRRRARRGARRQARWAVVALGLAALGLAVTAGCTGERADRGLELTAVSSPAVSPAASAPPDLAVSTSPAAPAQAAASSAPPAASVAAPAFGAPPEPSVPPAAAAAPAVQAGALHPAWIELPSVGSRRGEIAPVGLDDAGRMDTLPGADRVAWYAPGPVPGEAGNAILAGHRDWNGALGLFRALEELHPGDTVRIGREDGSVLQLRVASVATYPLDQVPDSVMSPDGPTRTTLITCAGRFVKDRGGYQDRVVVILEVFSTN